MGPGDEDTVRVVPPSPREPAAAPPQANRTPVLIAAGAAIAALVIGLGTWLVWPSAPPAPPAPAPVAAPAQITIRTASVAQIDANRSDDLDVFRLDANPRVLVLDFGSLARQGAMFNRVAALVEKKGLPRDHVLTEAELATAIKASGDTAETYYYGHDYGAADLRKFFRLAESEHVALTPDELWLRRLAQQEGMLADGGVGGVISIPAVGAAADIDAGTRRTILEHELSHGEFFTNPAFATWARRFWSAVMTAQEQAAMRRFLSAQNYDPTQEDLYANEAQAYLIFTRDPRLFTAALAGLTEDDLRSLRRRFRDGMPPGWLQDTLPAPAARPRRRVAGASLGRSGARRAA